MADTWNVTAAYDKQSYNKGDPIKVTINGGLTQTGGTPGQSGTLTLTVTAGGSTTTITVPATIVTSPTTTTQPAHLTGIVDTSNRVWTIAADGLSATSIA